jgi:Lrp/AsnC family transcriptional regulator, regulator for asnA, asnC and gidA
MDDLDQKLLSELQLSGFQKSESLAANLDIGGRTIRRRIGAMKSRGIIKVIAVPNPVLLGYRAWAKVGVKVLPSATEKVARDLVEHPSIYFVASSFGKFDFIIGVYHDTVDELTAFVNSTLARIPGIQSTETMVLISPRKYYNFSWPEPAIGTERRCEHCHTLLPLHDVDAIDREIVGILTQGEMTPPAIPLLRSRLDMAEGTIRKRIKDMLEHEVFRIEVAPNPAILGYEVWATIGIGITQRSAHEVINTIIKNPDVYLASTSIGRFNVVISTRFHNLELFTRFVNEELTKIPGVSSVESFLHTRPLKYHNIKWMMTVPKETA